MNRHLKAVIERGILLSGLPLASRRRNRHRALVLLYHNVVPDGVQASGELSLHLPFEQFCSHLDVLARTCDVVSLQELVVGGADPMGRPRVAITFDDAYAGALSIGVTELVRRGMPATIFVPPGLLGRSTWWDVVASQSAGVIPEARRADLLTTFAGNERRILGASQPARAAETSFPQIVEESQLVDAAKQPGIAIGSHTWQHPNLAAVSAGELRDELDKSLQWLRARFPTNAPFVSYPYGLTSPSVEAAAREVGYSAAFVAGGGWLPTDLPASRFRLPRYNVPAGISLTGFRLRLCGLGLG